MSNDAMIYGFITASTERDPGMYHYTTSQPLVLDALSNVALVLTFRKVNNNLEVQIPCFFYFKGAFDKSLSEEPVGNKTLKELNAQTIYGFVVTDSLRLLSP